MRRPVEQPVDEPLQLVVILQVVGLVFHRSKLEQESHDTLSQLPVCF
ncbi:MAG: hypothetical protein J7J17_01065 [Hadesarchaea archaeon]|nr:hypothetical protein [Hadesarchaea archaeon]